jgi:hypothetical protein
MELRPNEQRAKMAILMLMIIMILDIISLFSNTLEYQLLTSETIDLVSANANDLRQQIIGIIYLASLVVSATLFIRWFRRAYYNLHCRVNHLRHEETAARTYWFIPILSLIEPYKITKEMFFATEFYLKKNIENYKSLTTTHNINLWWTFWVITSILGNIIFRMSLNADTIDKLITICQLNLIDNVSSIIAAFLAIKMIKEYGKIETLFFETEVKSDEIEMEQIELN